MTRTVSVAGLAARPGTLSVVEAPGSAGSAAATVILFPGDLSTSRAVMQRSPFLAEWSRWSCEDLALLLARRWPAYNAVVVHPPRAVDGFSCYDGFLTNLGETGDPTAGYDGSGSASAHLLAQLESLSDVCSATSPLHLIGFSKGAVPLNQLVAEMGGEGCAADSPAATLRDRVHSIVWLDPGLNHEPGPILLGSTRTDAALLQATARRVRDRTPHPPRLAVALTPYQRQPHGWLSSWAFTWRAWPPIRRESSAVAARRRFEGLLRAEGVPVACEDCLMDQPASLDTHFEVLNAFTAPWDGHALSHGDAQSVSDTPSCDGAAR